MVIIVSFLLMSFKYILPAHLIECFGEMLLECDDKVVDMHHMSFSYCGEMEVYWEPRVIPKQNIMWAIAHDSRPHSIVSLN